jgi:hypothetical protein
MSLLWEGCRENFCAYLCVAGACDGHRDRHGCLSPQGAGSACLWGSELLTAWSARVFVGTAVFMVGVLAGAGFAAWVMPPV